MSAIGESVQPPEPTGTPVVVRYWAAARAAAGVDSETVQVSGPVDLATVLAAVHDRHPDARFRAVLATCALMVGDRPVTGHDPEQVRFAAGESLEVLPPFAGG